MPLIRYPGSKEKLERPILARFPDWMLGELWSNRLQWEYREPFFGAGAIGFKVLKTISPQCKVWINDIDPGIVGLWRGVRDRPDELIHLINKFKPNTEAFYLFKQEDGRTDLPIAEIGFRKLVLHRLSFSGLGFKAGGPIGGKDQDNAPYPVGCRWSAQTIKDDVLTYGKRLRRFGAFNLTNLDFEDLIRGAPRECFIYADPPYVKKGDQLYKHSMSRADHVRLRDALRDCRASWVLSYDDHPLVRELYAGWTVIEDVEIKYTTPTVRVISRPKNHEVIITPKGVAA